MTINYPRNSDYPPEMIEQFREAVAKKKTKEQGRDYIRAFVAVAAKRCGVDPPKVDAQFFKIGCYEVRMRYQGHLLLLRPSVRVQGDESRYMWEPGLVWRGGGSPSVRDRICVEYAMDENKHDCPSCECGVDHAATGDFTEPEELDRWLISLKR